MRFELFFMISCLGFLALLAAWSVLAFTTDLRGRTGFGMVASLLAALLFGVLWRADHMPWLWEAGGVKAVPMIWLIATVLNGFALASAREGSKGVLATTIALGVTGFVLHAFGAGVFLWGAAMSVYARRRTPAGAIRRRNTANANGSAPTSDRSPGLWRVLRANSTKEAALFVLCPVAVVLGRL